jgi:hypothetical protein
VYRQVGPTETPGIVDANFVGEHRNGLLELIGWYLSSPDKESGSFRKAAPRFLKEIHHVGEMKVAARAFAAGCADHHDPFPVRRHIE